MQSSSINLLTAFLSDAFEVHELLRLLHSLPASEAIIPAFNKQGSPDEVSSRLAELLLRRGEIDHSLFRALSVERPSRRHELARIEDALIGCPAPPAVRLVLGSLKVPTPRLLAAAFQPRAELQPKTTWRVGEDLQGYVRLDHPAPLVVLHLDPEKRQCMRVFPPRDFDGQSLPLHPTEWVTPGHPQLVIDGSATLPIGRKRFLLMVGGRCESIERLLLLPSLVALDFREPALEAALNEADARSEQRTILRTELSYEVVSRA